MDIYIAKGVKKRFDAIGINKFVTRLHDLAFIRNFFLTANIS